MSLNGQHQRAMSDRPDNPDDPDLRHPTDAPDEDEDSAAFRAAMAKVRPLHHDKIVAPPRRPAPRPDQRVQDEREVMREILADPPPDADLETGEELLHARPGLQHGLLRKLRRGQLSIGAELDMHGMTTATAKAAVVEFLDACRARHVRCVRIIHGKGNRSPNRQPVLKTHLAYWLRQRSEVLAFCSARPVDGGTGAIYVLLRR
ncbi:MAG TPA: Smr/MutS family protein [Gammaproteobacteria bacterium]|nr:Smr/MutS family protein [Gammaproteobacteria bacterium]